MAASRHLEPDQPTFLCADRFHDFRVASNTQAKIRKFAGVSEGVSPRAAKKLKYYICFIAIEYTIVVELL